MARSWDILASGFGLAEAPVVDGDGVVFSDVLGGGLHRVDGRGAVATVLPKRRGIGGVVPHAAGGFVVTGRDVRHIRPGEEDRVVLAEPVAGWNDAAGDGDGALWVGALRFAVFDPEAEVVGGEVWRVGVDGAAIVLDDVVHANGIGVVDGRLIVSDTRRRVLHVSTVDGDERREIDVDGQPDGMAVDTDGRVWVAVIGEGVVVAVDPATGTVGDRIDVPARLPTSVAFWGDRLVVTTGDHDSGAGGCVLVTEAPATGAPVTPVTV